MYLYIDRPVAELSAEGRFLLWSMRAWRLCRASRCCPPKSLQSAFDTMRASEAVMPFHQAMLVLDEIGQLDVADMTERRITEGEAILLALWQDLFAGDNGRAGDTLAFFSHDEGRLAAIAFALAQATSAFQQAGHHFAPSFTPTAANGGQA